MPANITASAAISGSNVVISGVKALGATADVVAVLGTAAGVVSTATVAQVIDGTYSVNLPLPPASSTPYNVHVSTSGSMEQPSAGTILIPAPVVTGAPDLAATVTENVTLTGSKSSGVPSDMTVSLDGTVVHSFSAQADGPWSVDVDLQSGLHDITVAIIVPVSATADTTVLVNPPLTIALQQSGTGIVATGTRNIGATPANVGIYVYAPGQTYQGHGITTVSNVADGPFTSATFGGTLTPATPWVVEARTTVGTTTYSVSAQITLSAVPVTPPPVNPPPVNPPPPVTSQPLPPPAPTGIVAQFDVQNNSTVDLPARIIRTARPFKVGALAAGLAGAQVDMVGRKNPDGSARVAMITLAAPAVPAGTSYRASLPAGPVMPGSPVAVTAAPLVVDLTNVRVGTVPHADIHIDLSAAIAASTDYWMRGPLATQVRVGVPVVNALHLIADVTFYADGNVECDVQFCNDLAMGVAGGDISYDAAIRYGVAVKFSKTGLVHWQYQDWHKVVWSGTAPAHNIAHPPSDLTATPPIHEYDLAMGYDPSAIGVVSPAKFDILGAGDFAVYMGQTGGRPDIGPDPAWIAAWIMGQTQAGRDYALAMSDAAGSIPWHMRDAATGDWLSLANRPALWADGRQTAAAGGLTQPIPEKYSYYDASHNVVVVTASGWNLDAAHQPDANFVPFMLTGDRYRHDLLVGQTTWDLFAMNPAAVYRNGAQGIIATEGTQTRAIAWSTRQVMEVAYISPSHGAEFEVLANNNLDYLIGRAAIDNQGEAAHWIRGQYGTALQIAPWQQDYVGTTMCRGDKLGFTKATQVLQLMEGFLAGRFLDHPGWLKVNGILYNMQAMTDASFTAIQTWAGIQAASFDGSGSGAPPAANWVALDGTPWPPNTFRPYYCCAISVLCYCAKHVPGAKWAPALAWLEANTTFIDAAAFRTNAAFSWAH